MDALQREIMEIDKKCAEIEAQKIEEMELEAKKFPQLSLDKVDSHKYQAQSKVKQGQEEQKQREEGSDGDENFGDIEERFQEDLKLNSGQYAASEI